MTSLLLTRNRGLVKEARAYIATGNPSRVEVSQTTTPPYPRRSTTRRWTVSVDEILSAREHHCEGWRWPEGGAVEAFVAAVRAGRVYDPFEGVA